MRYLSSEEFQAAVHFVEDSEAALDRIGLRLRVHHDMRRWVDVMRDAPLRGEINPTFDPDYSYVPPDRCFWFSFEEAGGRIVLCSCHRLFETEDFLRLVEFNHVFYDLVPVLRYHRPAFESETASLPAIAGRVGHAGGTWLHPDWRGIGLSTHLSRISRALALMHFHIDWFTAFVRDTARRRSLVADGFGTTHKIPLTKGYWPPYRQELDIQLTFMSRDEMISQCRAGPLPLIVPADRNGSTASPPEAARPTDRLPSAAE